MQVEVAHTAAWAELISDLRSLGFAVLVGERKKGTGALVRVTDSSTLTSDGKAAFVVIAKTRSLQALAAAIEAGACVISSRPSTS